MGPIIGMGLAIGTNDGATLIRSLKSLGTAVIISVLVSTLYFIVTPFGDVQSELIARTHPTLLDVVVAILGGVAGIAASSRKEKSNVIPGVAIATALMPPLCAAGYGLANANWEFFFGAFYLFLINSVFITLTTWLFVKTLKYPLVQYIDIVKQKRMKRSILVFSILIILPSALTFYDTIKESIFKQNAKQFLTEVFQFEDTYIYKKNIAFKSDSNPTIEVFLTGDIIGEKVEKELINKMPFYNLTNTDLILHQAKDKTSEYTSKLKAEVKSGILEDLYKRNEERINNKNSKIEFLEQELLKYKGNQIPFTNIKKEIKVQYKNAQNMSYGNVISTNFLDQQDTIPSFFIQWNEQLPVDKVIHNNEALQTWLRVRLDNKKVQVLSF